MTLRLSAGRLHSRARLSSRRTRLGTHRKLSRLSSELVRTANDPGQARVKCQASEYGCTGEADIPIGLRIATVGDRLKRHVCTRLGVTLGCALGRPAPCLDRAHARAEGPATSRSAWCGSGGIGPAVGGAEPPSRRPPGRASGTAGGQFGPRCRAKSPSGSAVPLGADHRSMKPAATKCAHARTAVDSDGGHARQLCCVNP